MRKSLKFYDALPKHKAELVDGKMLVGGSDETTKEWLGLLMMTLGMKETVKYLPKEAWSEIL